MSSVFRPVGEGGDWRRNGIFDKFHESDFSIAMGFADAARTLVKQWVAGHSNDGHMLPIIWLYRHALELVLKQNIRDAADCLRSGGESDTSLEPEALDAWLRGREAGHKLAPLAARLDDLLTRLKLENLPAGTHDVLNELHTLDPGGDAFRYSTVWSREQRRTVNAPRPAATHVDVVEMGAQFDEAFGLLAGGVATVLDEYLHYLHEMRSEYESDLEWYGGETFDDRW